MSKSDEYNVIQSLKIQVDNDRVKKPGEGSGGESMDDDYEEGEASSDGDEEVEVNVIVGSTGNKHDSELLNLDSSNKHSKTSKSTHRDKDATFYRPPAARKLSSYNSSESDNLKSFFKSNYSSSSKSRATVENEELAYDFDDDNDIQSKQKLLEERAKRFGFQNPNLSPEQVQLLYKSLEISNDDFNRGGFRADSIHCRGFENCKSSEIFQYFKEFHPHSIEWLTKTSCNVTMLNKEDAMRALVGLSCPIKPSKQIQNPKLKNKKFSNNKENSKSKKTDATAENKGIKTENKISKSGSSSSDSGSSSGSSSSESDDESSDSSSSSSGSSSSGSGSGSSSSSSSSSDSSSSSESDNENETKKQSPLREVTIEIQNNNNDNINNNNNSNNLNTGNQNNTAKENSQVNPRLASSSQMEVDNVNDFNSIDMDGSVSADYVGVVIPPGRWRLGVPCPNTKAILMRFAHCKDKKLPGLEKPIEYYEDILSKKIKRESPRKERRERTFLKARKSNKTLDVPKPYQPFYGPQERFSYDYKPRPPPSYGDTASSYKDLDDPVEPSSHPWGFLAQNWGKKETQENIDYQELLRQHVTGQKRKRDRSDDESDQEHDRPDFYHRSPRKSSSHHSSRKSKYRRQDFDRYYDDPYEEDEDELRGQNDNDDEDVVEWNTRIKLPIMRMYADAEEKKNERRKNNLKKGISNRLSQGRGGGTMWRESRRPQPNSSLDLRAKLMRKKLMA